MQVKNGTTCTLSKTYFETIHNWSADFPHAHALWSFSRPFESTATVANMPVSLGIRSLVLYFSTASKDIQGVVTNYFRTMSRRWSITLLLKFVVKNRRQKRASWGLLLRVEEHRTRHQNGMGKRETLSLIYDKCMQPGSRNRDKRMHWHERTTMSCHGRIEYF